MNKLNVILINSKINKCILNSTNNFINYIININDLSNYSINKKINKINNIINIYDNINYVNIIFYNISNHIIINKIIVVLNNIIYSFKKKYNYNIIFLNKDYSLTKLIEPSNIMNELNLYKTIVLDPNKNPISYLEYIKLRKPDNYNIDIFNTKTTDLFPLTNAVGMGSKYDSFFIHIFPKNNNLNKNLFLIGKGITFDTGGLNLKTGYFGDMKIDMTGSAIILSVLNLLVNNNIKTNYNIHLLLPIAENMIGNNAIRPGMVIKTISNKTVEIINTDAEGRLCIVDSIEYILKYLKQNNDDVILDIATLTGNVDHISSGISCVCVSNNKASLILDKLIKISEDVGEYLDKIIIRNEYLDLLISPVADIKNINENSKADCVIASVFLNYFINDVLPWIHLDLGCCVYKNNMVSSYGINLLYEFIKQIE